MKILKILPIESVYWSNILEEYGAIASLRDLVYIEFRAKVYGEGGKYTVRSLKFSGEHGWGRRWISATKDFFSSNNKLKYGKSKSVYETIVILVLNNEKKTYILQNALIHLRPHPCSPENLSERTVYLPLSSYTFARTSM